jgi:hypothetical protein
MRCQLQQVHHEGFHCQGEHSVVWQTLPSLEQNKMWTKNRVAALGNILIAGYCGGSDLYTLNDSSDEWTTQKGLHGSIWNVSSYENTCYVTAREMDRKVYQLSWNGTSHSISWHHITDIPAHIRDGSCSCPVVTKDSIYLLGGLLNSQPSNTAVVFDIRSEKWLPLPSMPFWSYNCSSVLIDKTLYLAGSRSRDSSGQPQVLTEVVSLRLDDLKWKRHSLLEYGNVTITALHDRLIATGGMSNDGNDVSNVYVFDDKSNLWLPLPSMLVPRSKHGVCVMQNSSLAVVGGQFNTTCEHLTILDQ